MGASISFFFYQTLANKFDTCYTGYRKLSDDIDYLVMEDAKITLCFQ